MALRRTDQPLIRRGWVDQRLSEAHLVFAAQPNDFCFLNSAPGILASSGDEVRGQAKASKLCRGDRRVGRAIELAWQNGATMDAWDEHFKPDVWAAALRQAGVDPDWVRHRRRETDELLPWDHIVMRRHREQLLKEYQRSLEQQAALAADECAR